jgi:hypothetical protein
LIPAPLGHVRSSVGSGSDDLAPGTADREEAVVGAGCLGDREADTSRRGSEADGLLSITATGVPDSTVSSTTASVSSTAALGEVGVTTGADATEALGAEGALF